NVVDCRRRNSFARDLNNMRIGSKFRSRLGEDAAGVARHRMVSDYSLDVSLFHELGPGAGNLMDQQVHAGAVFDDILIVARVGGEHRDAPDATLGNVRFSPGCEGEADISRTLAIGRAAAEAIVSHELILLRFALRRPQ